MAVPQSIADLRFKFDDPNEHVPWCPNAIIGNTWVHVFDVPAYVASSSCLAVIENTYGVELGHYWLWCCGRSGDAPRNALELVIAFAMDPQMRMARRESTDLVLCGLLEVLTFALSASPLAEQSAAKIARGAPSRLRSYSPRKFEDRARLILAGKWVDSIILPAEGC